MAGTKVDESYSNSVFLPNSMKREGRHLGMTNWPCNEVPTKLLKCINN
jgi:hypothetical protein